MVTLHRPDGDYSFASAGASWVPDADVNYKLTGTLGSFTVTTPDGREVEHYDANNQLSSVTTVGGALKYSLTYDSLKPTQLVQVNDDFGHELHFTYNGQGRLSTMTDPDGGVYQYGYDSNGNLTSVPSSDTKVRQYVYNESAYTASGQLHAMTGIVDESNSRFANFGYDVDGLAVLTEHAGGANRYTVSYATPPSIVSNVSIDVPYSTKYATTSYQIPVGTTVTDGLGMARHYGFVVVNGTIKTTSNDKPCSGACTAVAQTQSFDANGNVSSKTDFNGNITNYVYDLARNLETVFAPKPMAPRGRVPSQRVGIRRSACRL